MSEFMNNQAGPTENETVAQEMNAVATLQELSRWIDVELQLLECRHQSFETKESQRLYYQR